MTSVRRWSGLLVCAAGVALATSACRAGARSAGEKLWRSRCADCHGVDATGNTPRYLGNGWADLTDDSWRIYGGDDSAIETVIREGVFGEMPASDDLSPAEMRDLLAHLRKLRSEAAR